MNEYDRELLNEFVIESSELLESVEETLLGIDSDNPLDPEAINEIFRAVHSVKGTSGFFGLDVIGSLSHIMENVLGEMREGRLTPKPDLIDLLLSSNDRLRALVADPAASHGQDVSESVAALEVWMGGPSKQAPPAAAASTEVATPKAANCDESDYVVTAEFVDELRRHGQLFYRLDLGTQEDVRGKKRKLSAFFKHLGAVGKIVHANPSLETLEAVPTGKNVPFKVWLTTVLDPVLAPMGLALDAARVTHLPVDLLQPAEAPQETAEAEPQAEAAPEPEVALAQPALAAPTEIKRAPTSGHSDSLRVKTSLLDRLMQMAGELVLARNRLLRRLGGETDRIDGLGSILSELNGITSDMQEQIMQTRLQPLGTIFGRFSRVVHDLSKKLGKSVHLETIGGDVELDKALLEGLADPLTHMLRNSIDHGLEEPEGREKAGKPAQGTVTIRAYHEGGMVNIDVEDDGRGIDIEKLRVASIRKGLLSSDQASRTSDSDVLNLIFRPGFSTAAKVTETSGRGVGMDVVRTNIEKLGGVVEATTKLGVGSKMSIKLPLTLAIVTSLIVEVEGQRFALPQVGLESVVRLRADEIPDRIECIRDMDVLRYRDRLLPIVRLTDVLGMGRTFVDNETGERVEDRRGRLSDRRAALAALTQKDKDKRSSGSDRRQALANVVRILVLRIGRNSYGLVVDTIVENEEIVVKPLSHYLTECQCFSGATILGDGTIAMILDPVNIAQAANLTFSEVGAEGSDESAAERLNALKERVPLIHFTNGGPETFALPLAQVSRVENIPRTEIQRVGHKEYINYRGQALPLVRLHDHLDVGMSIEEPEQVKIIIPNLGGDAAGIVTNQVIDAREVDLKVDESTIRGQGLIGSAILDEEIVLVVDTYGLMESAGIPVANPEEGILGGRRALVVDDTPFMRRVTERYLTNAGMSVEVAGDGTEAWAMLHEGDFDVVVTDLRMPKLDGVGLLGKIRGADSIGKLPVVALADEGMADGSFDAYAQKLDRPELISALIDVLGHAQEQAA